MKIEIELPDGIDARQLYTHVVDAIGINDNITEQEYHALRKIMKTIKDAMPKMKRFNVVYYGVVDALNESDARIIADTFSPKNRECYISGYRGSYKHVSNQVIGCVPEDTKEYFVDGYHNKEPFSVFHVKPFYLTKREYEMALIPNNPESNITITKTYKQWDVQ